jgi:hypothetical protein
MHSNENFDGCGTKNQLLQRKIGYCNEKSVTETKNRLLQRKTNYCNEKSVIATKIVLL